MKDFVKMLLAVLAGMLLFSVVWTVMIFSFIGSVATLTSSQTPTVPKEGVLYMDLSTIELSEQETPFDISSFLRSRETLTSIGILDAVNAVNAAAADPGVKFIYLRPDGLSAGLAQAEELRTALRHFRESGKAIIAYTENPSNGSYFLASVADKVYVSSAHGASNYLLGISSQMYFLKDILDRLGVNMQLIRHGKYKSAGEMYIKDHISPENYEQNKVMIDSIWETFAKEIAASRGISVEKFNSLIDNLELVDSEDLVENGLADEALSREQRVEKICNLYMTDDIKKVNFIPFEDYAAVKAAAKKITGDQIAVIYADGEIIEGTSNGQAIQGDAFSEMVAGVRKDPKVKAVVLRVSSPGGSVLASDKIRQELDLLAAEKPLIASYGAYAASGGYWISSGCKYIYSDATTLTGSIGVFSLIPDFGGAVKNLAHVNMAFINSNRHSDMYSGMRALDSEEIDYMQKSVEDIYGRFTGLVADSRNLRQTYVDSIAQGRVWTGADAVKIGLVDEIGGLEDAIARAAAEVDGFPGDFAVVGYPAPLTTMEMLIASFEPVKTPVIFAGTPLENVEKTLRSALEVNTGRVYARMPYEYVIR